jgi:SAM-dependent methyltransferase
MSAQLKAWFAMSVLLGLTLAVVSIGRGRSVDGAVPDGSELVLVGGVSMLIVAVLAWLFRRRLDLWLGEDRNITSDDGDSVTPSLGFLTLFVISFAGLFLEVMLIRYTTAQIRVFSFYKNVPLVAAFLGMGLGCWLGGGGAAQALSFLLWLVPLAVALSAGSLAISDLLGRWAAFSTSEHILGDVVSSDLGSSTMITSQVIMGGFCVVTLIAITLLFTPIGRLLGSAFEDVPRIPAYTVNILGSLAGILLFLGLSYLETPPWIWFLVGGAPLLLWLRGGARVAGAVLVVLTVLVVVPQFGTTVWSPYQKLVGHQIPAGESGSGSASPAYLVEISDVFYQVALDLRPKAVAEMGENPYPHYDAAMSLLPAGSRVLVVGAGTGNDVAAALRAGSSHVDAVDIDPAIIEMGRLHHPERPYSDPRVGIIVDDARAAFRKLPPASYDAVVFGLLDSHTQLGVSSVRLDNYVFTVESLAAASELIEPGGHLILTAATFRPWFRDRLAHLLSSVCTSPLTITSSGGGNIWTTYSCKVGEAELPIIHAPSETLTDLPTDDWPFLYLPSRGVPRAYVLVVLLLAVASVFVLRSRGLRVGRMGPFKGHLFFLGAGFLLMEVYAVNRLALLFGTTWLVSAVTIALVLVMIVAANMTVLIFNRLNQSFAYLCLFLSLLASYFVSPSIALGQGAGGSIAYGLLLLSPVYFAGIVFARSFRVAKLAGPAIGANMLGSVLGGWVEYLTMATGIRALALLALLFYLASLFLLVKSDIDES